jgi:hypothetical protein
MIFTRETLNTPLRIILLELLMFLKIILLGIVTPCGINLSLKMHIRAFSNQGYNGIIKGNTLRKKHHEWIKLGVYERTYENSLKKYLKTTLSLKYRLRRYFRAG